MRIVVVVGVFIDVRNGEVEVADDEVGVVFVQVPVNVKELLDLVVVVVGRVEVNVEDADAILIVVQVDMVNAAFDQLLVVRVCVVFEVVFFDKALLTRRECCRPRSECNVGRKRQRGSARQGECSVYSHHHVTPEPQGCRMSPVNDVHKKGASA